MVAGALVEYGRSPLSPSCWGLISVVVVIASCGVADEHGAGWF